MAEDIIIRIRAIDDASGVISKVGKNINRISGVVNKNLNFRQFESLSKAANLAGLSLRNFNKIIAQQGIIFSKGIGFMDKFTGQTVKMGQVSKGAAIQAKRFKFEWLSVMFAGQALSRVFGGIVRAQFELFGITKTLSSAWTIVMLPVMELLTPILFKMLEIFMNMPKSMKLALGIFILIGAAVGILLAFLGALVLAAMGIGAIFGSGLGFGLIIIGAVTAAIMVLSLLAGVVISNWSKIKGFFANLWDGIKNIFVKSWEFITDVFKLSLAFIISIPGKILNAFMGLGRSIMNTITDIIPNWMISLLRNGISLISGGFPGFATGGMVNQTGLATVHKGERVIPRSVVNRGTNSSANIVINMENNINSNVDIDHMIDEVNRRLAPELERAIGRGTI